MDNGFRQLALAADKKYGTQSQIDLCIEEMSELTKELIKRSRGKDNFDAIAEEVADVQIMINQLKVSLDMEDAVRKHFDAKLKKLKTILSARI
ncbi:MAG: hypothetical protein FWD33_03175 [Alphaproteobacteria bacterium]|nr:hypothetical protein [Alphaproteobacteria bacterium]